MVQNKPRQNAYTI